VAERLNAAVSKTVVRLIGVPGVRISPPPCPEVKKTTAQSVGGFRTARLDELDVVADAVLRRLDMDYTSRGTRLSGTTA
jgi:hypothetical protein